jgi:hypothetical protein
VTPTVLRRRGRRRCCRNPARADGASFRQGCRGFGEHGGTGELLTENKGRSSVRAEAVERGEVRLQTGYRCFGQFRSEPALIRARGDKGMPPQAANWAQHVTTRRPIGGPHRRLLFPFPKIPEIGFPSKKNIPAMSKNPGKFVEVENPI